MKTENEIKKLRFEMRESLRKNENKKDVMCLEEVIELGNQKASVLRKTNISVYGFYLLEGLPTGDIMRVAMDVSDERFKIHSCRDRTDDESRKEFYDVRALIISALDEDTRKQGQQILMSKDQVLEHLAGR